MSEDPDMASRARRASESQPPIPESGEGPRFTPGPLAVWGSLYEGFEASVVVANSDPLRTLAQVRNYRDAVLYAAAPDLYEALKAMVAQYGHRDERDDLALLRPDQQTPEIEDAMKAIAKAQGRQP